MDEILRKQIVDLERAASVSPSPKSQSVTPTADLHKVEASTPDPDKINNEDRSQSYDLDALGGDEGLKFAYLRHSPVDSDFDSSSVSSYHSLSPTPMRQRRKKFVMFKDEQEAFEYFKVKHFDLDDDVQPGVGKKDMMRSQSEPPPAPPPRGSSRSRTAARMLGRQPDAEDVFKIQHYDHTNHNKDKPQDYARNVGSPDHMKSREEYIEQLNKYTPRIQPAVPVRRDSSKKFQQKLMELSRLSAACGQVADQIKHDHQEYWGALTHEYKVPGPDQKSLVSEAYQRMSFTRPVDTVPKFPVAEAQETQTANTTRASEELDERRAVQTNTKGSEMISAAVSDNIMNIASAVSPTQAASPTSPRTVRNEIRVNVTPTPPTIPEESSPRVSSPVPGHSFWSTSSPNVSRVNQDNYHSKRSVTWCDDLTSTDDDRMSDSSASVTPDRKLEPASSSLKSIQKGHSQKRKKKKVSWSDDYNTDDDRHSSSTSLSSSVFEPNSPDVARHLSTAPPGFGSTAASPLNNVQPNGTSMKPNEAFHRNSPIPLAQASQSSQKACPVYGQPILAAAAVPGNASPQTTLATSGNHVAPPGALPAGYAKTSIGVQRFKADRTDNPFPVIKSQAPPKIPPFPLDLS